MQTSPPPPSPPALDMPVHALPARWSEASHKSLHDFLDAHRSGPVGISAAALKRLDSLMVQFLLSAARDWAGKGQDFVLTQVPDHVESGLELLGITPAMLRRMG
jgi:anti-anti-sigma regulatory factor